MEGRNALAEHDELLHEVTQPRMATWVPQRSEEANARARDFLVCPPEGVCDVCPGRHINLLSELGQVLDRSKTGMMRGVSRRGGECLTLNRRLGVEPDGLSSVRHPRVNRDVSWSRLQSPFRRIWWRWRLVGRRLPSVVDRRCL